MRISCVETIGEVYYNTETSEVRGGKVEGINETTDELFGLRHECKGKVSLEKAQQSVEFFHNRSKEQILELHGEYIYGENYERIGNGVDSIQVIKYNPNETSIGSFFYHNGETHIRVCNIDQEQLERTTQHETMDRLQ